MLLRLYGGQLYTDFTKISETYVAKGLKLPVEELITLLKHLHEIQLVVYNPTKDKHQLTIVMARQDADHLPINTKRLEERKTLANSKMEAMVDFVTSSHRCRMQIIQDYFDEETDQTCGKCDVCIAKKKEENRVEVKELHQEILNLLSKKLYTIEQLEKHLNPRDTELFIDVIREMVDGGELEYDTAWRLRLKKNR
jgi:ATP-dependent DNA helicase RecQ